MEQWLRDPKPKKIDDRVMAAKFNRAYNEWKKKKEIKTHFNNNDLPPKRDRTLENTEVSLGVDTDFNQREGSELEIYPELESF